jgi:hypothetical protein
MRPQDSASPESASVPAYLKLTLALAASGIDARQYADDIGSAERVSIRLAS